MLNTNYSITLQQPHTSDSSNFQTKTTFSDHNRQQLNSVHSHYFLMPSSMKPANSSFSSRTFPNFQLTYKLVRWLRVQLPVNLECLAQFMLLCFHQIESVYQEHHLHRPLAPALPSFPSYAWFYGDLRPHLACELSTHELNAREWSAQYLVLVKSPCKTLILLSCH